MKIVKFDLTDADGVSHTYEVKLFPVAESVRLQLIVAGPLIKAVGRLAAALAPALKSIQPDAGPGEFSLREILANVDWDKAPEILLSLPEMIEKRGGAQLVSEIFASTTRLIPIEMLKGLPTVGDKPIEPFHRQELRLLEEQEAAFGDGNWGEYWQAVAMVLLVNFTRYGRHGSLSLKQLFEKLTLGALQSSQRTTETARPSEDTRPVKGPPSG